MSIFLSDDDIKEVLTIHKVIVSGQHTDRLYKGLFQIGRMRGTDSGIFVTSSSTTILVPWSNIKFVELK